MIEIKIRALIQNLASGSFQTKIRTRKNSFSFFVGFKKKKLVYEIFNRIALGLGTQLLGSPFSTFPSYTVFESLVKDKVCDVMP